MDELFAQEEIDIKPYAVDAHFYLGKVYTSSTSYCYCYIDGINTSGQTFYVIKPSTLSLSANNRVVIMEVDGTYLVLARIT